MAGLILGIILLAVPFVLLGLFSDKKKGFIYVLFFLLLFHTVLAFLSQFFGIFYYPVVVGVNLLLVLGLLIPVIARSSQATWQSKIGAQNPWIASLWLAMTKKIDWALVLVIIIASLSLYQVHYNYTGKINLATDRVVSYHEVKNMEYVYPYFSDEWYAVSLIKHSINSHSLPLWDALSNGFFLNIEMFFHSLLAEIILLLGLNPLTQYVLVSIFINVLIIVLAYIFLRLNNVLKLTAAIASLSILYITSGANLPGIWHFIPVHLGIVFSLIGLCFLTTNNLKMAALISLPIIIFYGPLFVFYGLALLVFSVFRFKDVIKKHATRLAGFTAAALAVLPVFYIVLTVSPLAGAVDFIYSKLFYTSFTGFNMPQFKFYNIIPLPIILSAVLGLSFVFKGKKWLFFPLLLGVFYWFFYSFTINRFVIEYERAVFFTSIIIAIISGFGLQELGSYINSKVKNTKFPIFKYIEVGAIVLFLLLIPFYTQRENWKKLVLINQFNGAKSYPKSPANNYLTEDDIKIFENIKGKRFLSIPWKGTVIGIASDNHPVVTKGGTISVGEGKTVDLFLNSDCGKKFQLAKEKNIDYVYLTPFLCPNFQEIDKSREGLNLYEVIE